jgi:uncharacterized protein (DUF362 family)
MNRRSFLKGSITASVLAGPSLNWARATLLGPWLESGASAPPYDLVAVKGGEPTVMFDKGIEAMGGLNAFVKKGQKVVVKPNIGWDVSPERAGNTNPRLVAHITKRCYEAGAKQVFVFDHTCDDWQSCYRTSGIESAARDAGAKVVPGNSERYYHDVEVPKGKNLKKSKVHELILDSDVFINVPVLKSHSSAKLTIAMKNLMGIVWDRREWHANDLHQCIADFSSCRKPDLNVVDAYAVMKRNGPRGISVEDVVELKSMLLSTDMVTVDAAGAKLVGREPLDIPHIRIAAENYIGRVDLEKLNIKRIVL